MPDFRAKMHQKIDFGWGCAPSDPAGGAYSAPQEIHEIWQVDS